MFNMHVPPTPRPAPAWSLGEQVPAAWRRSRAWLAELDGRADRRGLTAGRHDMRNMQILLYDKLRDSLVRFEGGGRGVGVGVSGVGRAVAYPTLRSWYRPRYQHDAWPAASLGGLGGISAVQLSPPGISVQVVEAGAPGRGAGAGARAVGGVGGGWAAGGWVMGVGLLAALLLLARLTEICGAFKPKLRRSPSASDWQSSNNAANGQNGGVSDSEFPGEAAGADQSGDLPPPYSSCACAGDHKYTADLEEPPPPYSACYVTCTIPKDGIPSVHFYNNRNQDLFLHRVQEANTSAHDDTQLDFHSVVDSSGDERNAIDNRNTESVSVSDSGVENEENDGDRETSGDGSRDDVGTPFVRARDSNNSLRSHTEVLSRAQLV